jgi:hypothetical protein
VPFVFQAIWNGEGYLELLQNEVGPALVQALGENYRSVIFKEDRAPAHFALNVREFLDATFQQWNVRGSPVEWPARSPDLTSLDYFLGGT